MVSQDKARRVLGWKLALARKSRRLTQDQAADAIGIHKQTLSNWERGVKEPTFLLAVALMRYYDVDVEWLAEEGMAVPEGGSDASLLPQPPEAREALRRMLLHLAESPDGLVRAFGVRGLAALEDDQADAHQGEERPRNVA